jgi:hypothetical protein
MKNSILTLATFVLLAAVSFTSCKKDEEVANVMVVHASPDAPSVDVLVDDTKVNSTALAFPKNTGYLEVTAGQRNLKVNASGATTSVINANVTFDADKNYSVFAINAVADISAVVFEDNLAAPASGKAHVRFIHLSPTAPAVDIALDGGAVVFQNIAYKEGAAFTPVDAGSLDLEVRVAGTQTVALDLDPITLEAGKIYTVFARGFLAGTGAQALGAEIIVNK